MKKNKPAVFYIRVAMAAVAIFLPLVSLIVLGSVWLWQQGYVLYWALAACSITVLTYALERGLLRADLPDTAASVKHLDIRGEPDPAWSVGETIAWTAVVELAGKVRPLEITSRDQVFDLGVRTIETVAASMHPGDDHALWKFTLPEALALIERVSAQLSEFVSSSIPLGDRMTVGQFLRVYRWRTAVNVAEQAYDLWRIIRLINPAAAATQEIREQLTRRAYDWGREELARRIVQAYVREVGRAAIDLYSGRMRIAESKAPADSTAVDSSAGNTSGSGVQTETLVRIIFAGTEGTERSRWIGAMIADVHIGDRYSDNTLALPGTLRLPDGNLVLVLDSPDVSPADPGNAAFFDAVAQGDLIIWVSSERAENRPFEIDVLNKLRTAAAVRVNRKPPEIVYILTTSDADAVASAGRDFHVSLDKIILGSNPVELRPALLHLITTLMPGAERAKALRLSDQRKTGFRWRRLATQVINAGRTMTRRSG